MNTPTSVYLECCIHIAAHLVATAAGSEQAAGGSVHEGQDFEACVPPGLSGRSGETSGPGHRGRSGQCPRGWAEGGGVDAKPSNLGLSKTDAQGAGGKGAAGGGGGGGSAAS